MVTLLQAVDHMQTLDMDEFSTPFAWGEEDGLAGKSEFTGYDYFVGHGLTVYLAAHAAGCAMRQRLTATVLATVRSELQCMDDALETIRQQPAAHGPFWYAAVEGEDVGRYEYEHRFAW